MTKNERKKREQNEMIEAVIVEVFKGKRSYEFNRASAVGDAKPNGSV